MKFEVGKIYKLFWSQTGACKAVCRCINIDEPRIPGLRPIQLSVSKYFDDLGLFWYADENEVACEATEDDLERYAKEKEIKFHKSINSEFRYKRPSKSYEQLTLW